MTVVTHAFEPLPNYPSKCKWCMFHERAHPRPRMTRSQQESIRRVAARNALIAAAKSGKPIAIELATNQCVAAGVPAEDQKKILDLALTDQ